MGVGYQVSALHQISYLVTDEAVAEPVVPPPWLLGLTAPGPVEYRGVARFRSPAKADIVAWRDRASAKYRAALGEELRWDEDTEFSLSEDAAVSADVLLRYVAAILDERGDDVAARALTGTMKPSHDVMRRVFAAAENRRGRFPHLLQDATYWFPFARDVVFEEQDWNGNVKRYGSARWLSQELDAIRRFIANADPRATAWTAHHPDDPPDVLSAAWQASDTVSRLCAVAIEQRLPFWTTG